MLLFNFLAFPVKSDAIDPLPRVSGHVGQLALGPGGVEDAATVAAPGTVELPFVGEELNPVHVLAALALDGDDVVVGVELHDALGATVAAVAGAPNFTKPENKQSASVFFHLTC